MNLINTGSHMKEEPCVMLTLSELQGLQSNNARSSRMQDEYADEGMGFDPLKLISYAIQYRWLILGFLIVGMLAGLINTWSQTPLYSASARLEIQTPTPRVFEEFEVVSQYDRFSAMENVIIKFNSEDISRRIVYELNLGDEDAFIAPKPGFSLLNLVDRAVGADSESTLSDWTKEEREAAAVGLVRGGLSVSIIRDSSVVRVSFTHEVPKYTALVANQAMRSYVDYTVDKTSESSDLARQFLNQRVVEAKAKLQNSEKALVNYAKAQNITVTGNDASLIADNIAQLNEALAEAIQERLAAERDFAQVNAGKITALPAIYESETIQTTKQKIADLKANYEEKRSTLKPDHPEMRKIQAQITELQRQIKEETATIGATVETRAGLAAQKEDSIRRALGELETKQREFQDKNIQYTILKREVDSNRTQYDQLIAQLSEVGIGSELKNTNASIIDYARMPGAPFTPRLERNMLMALVLFGALCAAMIYLIELISNKFDTPERVESELKLPVLGTIPETDEETLIKDLENPRSKISENYSSLRSSLRFTGVEQDVKSLLVTSSQPGEGKSTSVYKLAQDFAALGRRVLVIDADLRKPRLHEMYSVSEGPGLSNLLSNVIDESQVLDLFQRTKFPGVTFLSAGTPPPNPADLLSSSKMGALLRCCSRYFDLIIIDSPPILDLADAQILSGQVDATMLVVSSKSVTRKSAKAALARLDMAGANVVGAALTCLSMERLSYAYAYRHLTYSHDEAVETPANGTVKHYAPWLERDLQLIRNGFSGAVQYTAQKLTPASENKGNSDPPQKRQTRAA
ncbi:MAG: polysaccharide biosynthesis tyrosine autokinase [Pseudomonadota bacterium]